MTVPPLPPRPMAMRWLQTRIALAAGLVLMADVLFYGHAVGVSLGLFLASLSAASFWANPVRATGSRRLCAFLLLGAGLLAIMEEVRILSSLVAAVCTAGCAVMLGRKARWQQHLNEIWRMPFAGAFRLTQDIRRVGRLAARRSRPRSGLGRLVGWIVPLVFLGVFAGLFASANPVFETWLDRLDPRLLLDLLSPWRVLLWLLILCLIWPIIHVSAARRRKMETKRAFAGKAITFDPHGLFGDAAVLRSLILFNALFAVQTGLDVAYLWGGVALPDEMSYASYAHRGAYPLVVTALLAAAFVLLAMRPAGASGRNRLVRPLVLAFVGQNIVLMVSSLLRLDLYVAIYSLTWLRLVAFVWMTLVAVGLVLIVVQIAGRRSTTWLVSANAAALALTLYGACFVDASVVIANYNFRHSKDLRGVGASLDLSYLASLGPGIIPAIDRYAPRIAAAEATRYRFSWPFGLDTMRNLRVALAERHLAEQADWRAWGFRAWRLSRYLASTPRAPFGRGNSPAPSGP